MTTTTRELITKSWYLSGIVARSLQTVSGEQISDGLELLNSLLSFKTVDDRKIPYFTKYDFVSVQGQEEYFIPGLIQAETLTFELDTVRYSMRHELRVRYFGTPRANNVQSLPYIYHVERALGGANLFMYYLPNKIYNFELYGNFSLLDVTLDQDLELVLDKFYIEYLRYLLADYICDDYNISFPLKSAERLKAYEAHLTDVSPMDLSMQKKSILQKGTGVDYYADANILKGWRP